jgi:hypothetical protein
MRKSYYCRDSNLHANLMLNSLMTSQRMALISTHLKQLLGALHVVVRKLQEICHSEVNVGNILNTHELRNHIIIGSVIVTGLFMTLRDHYM